jgi:hypothetical protein
LNILIDWLKRPRFHLASLIFSLSLFLPQAIPAGEIPTSEGASTVKIISPQENEIIPPNKEVKIVYQFVKGLKDNGDHLHVTLDGENEGTTKRTPRILGILLPGKHTLELKIENREHDEVGISATVHFEVSKK